MMPSGFIAAASAQPRASGHIELAQADTGRQPGGAAKADRGAVASGKGAAPAVNAPATRSPRAEPRIGGGGRDIVPRTTIRQRSGGDVPAVKGAVERRSPRDRQVDRPAAPPRAVDTPRVRPDGQRARRG